MQTHVSAVPVDANLKQVLFYALFFAVGIVVADLLLQLLMPFKFALPIGLIGVQLAAYPLVVRTMPNRWASDMRPCGFLPFITLNFALAIAVFLMIHFG